MSATADVTPERIMQLAFGYAPPLMIEAAIRNRVFDLLDEGPKTVEEIAAVSGASSRALRILMNALAGVQLIAKNGDGRYTLAPDTAMFLVSTKPSYYGGLVRHTSEQLLPAWMKLGEVVATGKPTRPVDSDGGEFFADFVADLFPMSYQGAQMLGDALGLPEAKQPVRVLDLAAGSGVWGIALAQKSAQVSITALDLPGVIETTKKMVARFGLSDRFHFKTGDLRTTDFGGGYHVATLGHILHSEGAARSRDLLRKTYAALAPGATVAIADFLVNDDRTGPSLGLIFAVNMLVNTTDGDTFSFEEIAGWLREAGFVDPRPLDIRSHSPLVLATKPR